MFIIYLGKKLKLGPDFALYQFPEIDIKHKTLEKQDKIQENICCKYGKQALVYYYLKRSCKQSKCSEDQNTILFAIVFPKSIDQ